MKNTDHLGHADVDASPAQRPDTGSSTAGEPAYIVGHIKVKNAEKWREYCDKVPATVAPWGASLVFRGERAQVLAGDHGYTDTVVIRFPSRAAIMHWHESEAYQALIGLREQAADVVIISYEGQL
jgi:uncharacterized protein (DUF1330 family)